MEAALIKISDCKDKVVKKQKAELDFLSQCEKADQFMQELMKGKDSTREKLQAIFGGDSTRLESCRAVVDSAELSGSNANDKRPERLRTACDGINKVRTKGASDTSSQSLKVIVDLKEALSQRQATLLGEYKEATEEYRTSCSQRASVVSAISE